MRAPHTVPDWPRGLGAKDDVRIQLNLLLIVICRAAHLQIETSCPGGMD